jgi:hypothetical protein
MLRRGLLLAITPAFMPEKAICIPRQTTLRTLQPSTPAGMKNYQEDDYFCRQTYELLTSSSFKMGYSTIALLVPAISNGTCCAKLLEPRK